MRLRVRERLVAVEQLADLLVQVMRKMQAVRVDQRPPVVAAHFAAAFGAPAAALEVAVPVDRVHHIVDRELLACHMQIKSFE